MTPRLSRIGAHKIECASPISDILWAPIASRFAAKSTEPRMQRAVPFRVGSAVLGCRMGSQCQANLEWLRKTEVTALCIRGSVLSGFDARAALCVRDSKVAARVHALTNNRASHEPGHRGRRRGLRGDENHPRKRPANYGS